jgi:NADPH-dependent 2,4-dienoyl-CoA reductase/sulfur reductase-like enzyme
MSEFLIIGADAAGLSAANQIKRKLPKADIRVINKGTIISYGACGIPYVLSGEIESPQKLIHFTPESFLQKQGIPVEINKEAVSVSPGKYTVKIKDTSTGEIGTEKYKKLFIGTGAIPKKFSFIDTNEEGVFNLHDIKDLCLILDFLDREKPKKAGIIGAGNIGCELAEALNTRGMDIFVFDILESPVANWPESTQKAVLDKMKEKGIHFLGGTAVQSVEKTASVFTLYAGDTPYKLDIIFIVAGTKPATDFCHGQLKCLENGAILIDRKGQTSDPNIYAAGDCASVYHKILDRAVYMPLGSTANKMGRVAGINLAGGNLLYPGIVGTQIFKFFELSLAKTGLSRLEAEIEGIKVENFSAVRSDRAGYYPGSAPARVEITVDAVLGQILGANTIYESNAAPIIDAAATAVYSGLTVDELGWFDSAYAPPYAPVWNALVSAALKAVKT